MVGGNYVPRCERGTSHFNCVLVVLYVIRPKVSFRQIIDVEFPLLFWIFESVKKSPFLLVSVNMQVKFKNCSSCFGEIALKIQNLLVSSLKLLFRYLLVNS